MTRPGADRDRDLAGRPKNARPRDGLGRPLDRAAAGEPVMPEELRLTPADAVQLAQRLIDDGRPFHAHEVLEATWKSAPDDQRDLWKGLAQIAVGLTHARRGNGRGAVTLLRRGAAAVASYAGSPAGPEQAGDGAPGPGAGGAGAGRAGAGRPGAGRTAAAVAEAAGLDLPAILDAATRLADLIGARGLDAVNPDDLRLPLSGPRRA